ncbi:hypothetical protein MTO96_012440 [Rhipicephalus appendiculatus]
MTTAPEVQEPQSAAAAATALQSATATSMKQKPQPVTVADGDIEYGSMTVVGAAQESQSVLKEEPQLQALPDVPADTVSMTVAPEAGESECTTAAAMVQEPDSVTDGIVITESKVMAAAEAAQESHYMTVTVVELKSAATVAREQKLQPMTSANLGAEFQSRTAAEAAQKPQSATVAAMKPDLTIDSMGQEPQRKVLVVIPEPQSATAIDVTSVSDKLAEQAEEIASYLATHGPVDYVDESTVSICASPEGSCDLDDENVCKQVTSIPNEALVPLTRDISTANTEMSSTVPNKLLEFDLRTQQQAPKNAVASSPATQMFSATLVDTFYTETDTIVRRWFVPTPKN